MAGHALHAFRHLPLSPPDTDHDIPPSADFDMTAANGHYPGATPERSRLRPRRTSTLSYQHSGVRVPLDRSHQRSPKNLVVVIPPPDFPLDQGRLGNVLSMGPRHRLSQGILMPLFPSMFGQLNAIAREYNFPSTVGLCLYFHINENGITMTPRISDDSWQYLFGHLFEDRAPSGGHQLPIGGSIEFDIDTNKARWFDAWVSGTLRDLDPPFPQVAASQASFAHWRGESRTTDADEQPAEDRWDVSGSATLVANSRSATLRHLPKKLSLVDRFESHGIHVPPKLQNGSNSPLSAHETHAGLSPIPQSAIPRPSKNELERRVKSWRASMELYPLSMAEAYQPSPDAEIPVGGTTMDEYALERNFEPAVNIGDFIWSGTSAGPRTPPMGSPIASSRPCSIHLDRRVGGTVQLTPSTVTSWGPADDDWFLVVSDTSRLPSPDLGERMVEDTLVPRRSAVWGNSFGWRSASAWKEAYPYAHTKPAIRVQLEDSNGIVPRYPNLVIYPTVHSRPDAHSPSVWGSSFGWKAGVTWKKVYPHSITMMRSVSPIQLVGAGGLVPRYPNICIYPAVYPYSEIYPACTIEEDTLRPVVVMLDGSNSLSASYPRLVIYPAVYPHLDLYPPVAGVPQTKGGRLQDTTIYSLNGVSASYPSFVIYPAVYPRFDLYPKALQVAETFKQKAIDVRLVNTGCLPAEYPNVIIYPGVYPHLEIYPAQDKGKSVASVVWGSSFGWLTAKTWLQVYPLSANLLETKGQFSTPPTVYRARKPAVWGSSFGWETSTTWRTVWPTSRSVSPTILPEQQSDSHSNYPYLNIYPAAYPYFDIYPPPAAGIVEVEELLVEQSQSSVSLVPHYPNLVIYPAVYPHLDVYPAFARAVVAVERTNGYSNLRRRRIEMWRAKLGVQAGLVDYLWEGDEPRQLDLADYAWSPTSAGPPSPLELSLTPSIRESVHIDRRVRGSVLLTPSTATTWGPQDDDLYSDIASIDRLPSPDLGQRILEDSENSEFPHQPWNLVWPFFESASQVKNLVSVFEKSVLKYPHLVIYPPAYPHFDLYPAPAGESTLKQQVTETFADWNTYLILDIYPAVYPHFNIYPSILQIESPTRVIANVQHEKVEVRLPSLYPSFDIYPASYPYNLDHIYPLVNVAGSTPVSVETSETRGYPWLVIYPAVYPFIIPYPDCSIEIDQPLRLEASPIERKPIDIKLSAQYPVLDIYPVGYPWSLESIYPAVSVDDFPETVKPKYPFIFIYAPVYPFVQPYYNISDSVLVPGTLDEREYESAKAVLALLELKCIHLEPVAYPYFDLYPARAGVTPQLGQAVQDAYDDHLASPPRRARKTHMELHIAVVRMLEKQRARISKMHSQLHSEVFQDGVVWTPSGYMQDISSFTRKRPVAEFIPAPETQRRPSQDHTTPRPARSRSATTAVQSPDKVVFPLGQPPAIPPLRVRSPGVPSQPPPAVSETPMPRVSSPTSTYTHMRTTSSRISQAVKSMIPGAQRRNSSAQAPASPPPEDKDRQENQSPMRFLSLADRRPAAVSLPHTNTSEMLTRVPQSTHRKESLVLQRARAYEQSAANQTSGTAGNKGTHSPFTLPPLPMIPPMSDMAEAIEKSKITFS